MSERYFYSSGETNSVMQLQTEGPIPLVAVFSHARLKTLHDFQLCSYLYPQRTLLLLVRLFKYKCLMVNNIFENLIAICFLIKT